MTFILGAIVGMVLLVTAALVATLLLPPDRDDR